MSQLADRLKPGTFMRTGHRGAAGLAPENTMVSFQKAVDIGVDCIELDVQSTADGRIVVLHDETVDRTTNGTGRIVDLSWDRVRGLDAGFHFGAADSPFRGKGVGVPLLEEVLDAYPDMVFTVEIKPSTHPAFIETLCSIIRSKSPDRLIVAAEDLNLIKSARQKLPRIPTNFSRPEVRAFYFLAHLHLGAFFISTGSVFQVPCVNRVARGFNLRVVTPRFISAAHDRGFPVQVWTINDPDKMRALIKLGVDGITTDRPDILNDVLNT